MSRGSEFIFDALRLAREVRDWAGVRADERLSGVEVSTTPADCSDQGVDRDVLLVSPIGPVPAPRNPQTPGKAPKTVAPARHNGEKAPIEPVTSDAPEPEQARPSKKPRKNTRAAPQKPAENPTPDAEPALDAQPTFTGRPPSGKGRRPRRTRTPRTEAPPPGRPDIPHELIDHQAVSAVRRLQRAGFKAYLVGGCVRDLLLNLHPKDFDVTTDARPEQVKKVFRNSRIIGRRFKLVHLYYRDGKQIEVATFRGPVVTEEETPEGQDEDLYIRRDNVWGTEEEDAQRRDFTVNGLFYDATTGKVIDHVNGMQDIRDRVLRMIGDPEIRLREDPVRMLRAVRFMAKIDLTVEPGLAESIRRHREDILKTSTPRLLEETLRLLRIGYSAKTVEYLEDFGLLQLVLPELSAYLDGPDEDDGVESPPGYEPEPPEVRRDRLYGHFEALDYMIGAGDVTDAAVIATTFYAPLTAWLERRGATHGAPLNAGVAEYVTQLSQRIALTRKLSEQVRQIFLLQRHMGRVGLGATQKRRRRPSLESLMRRVIFADAVNVYAAHVGALAEEPDEIERWCEQIADYTDEDVFLPIGKDDLDPSAEDEEEPPRRRRRRRR